MKKLFIALGAILLSLRLVANPVAMNVTENSVSYVLTITDEKHWLKCTKFIAGPKKGQYDCVHIYKQEGPEFHTRQVLCRNGQGLFEGLKKLYEKE